MATACGDDAVVASTDLAGADFAGLDLTGVDLAGAPLTPTTSVRIVVEPGDNGSALLTAITGATTSVHMTMYQLTASNVVDALIARKKAGKDVKVLLNKTFPGNMGSNAGVFSQLTSAGVACKYAPDAYQYTHEKAVVIDGATALIMTMNASTSAFSGNREFVAVDQDPDDVAETEALFQADWAGQTSTHSSGKLITAPDNAEGRLVGLIDSATATIDLEGETFSADSILQAVGRADKRGVKVRIVLSDEAPSSAQTTAVMGLKQVGIAVRSLSNPFVHAKALVVDGKIAYVGSENFTANSLQNNRELGVLVGKQSEVDTIASTIAADFAAGTAL